ncbi:MAG: DNA cytosine methyltransferase, partial [Promethearchaeota archaeon]
DQRSQLYEEFINVVDHFKPKIFVMENVKGILSMKHVKDGISKREKARFLDISLKIQKYKDLKRYRAQRQLTRKESDEFVKLKNQYKKLLKQQDSFLKPVIEKIISGFNRIGYNVKYKLLNAVHYGVPQKRERVIFIGSNVFQINDSFFPIPTHGDKSRVNGKEDKMRKKNASTMNLDEDLKSFVTVKDAIGDLEDEKENKEWSHEFTKHKEDFVEKLSAVPIGETLYKRYRDAWFRLFPDQPSKTVKENHGGVFIHYKFPRVLTPRELARLQSFPDNFIFKGTKSNVLKQIGNAVPPGLARAIAKSIKIVLNEFVKKQVNMIK